jgi:predicted nuclease of predicted toxin-antitoxin system
MKVLIDMNLSPLWVKFLVSQGFEAIHWSTVGDIRAADAIILQWSRENQHILFTHDLDFSALLAATLQTGPSVLQIRSHDVMPSAMGGAVVRILTEYEEQLRAGALITIDEVRSRVRILPIR